MSNYWLEITHNGAMVAIIPSVDRVEANPPYSPYDRPSHAVFAIRDGKSRFVATISPSCDWRIV